METIEVYELKENFILEEFAKTKYSINDILKNLINPVANYPLSFFNAIVKKDNEILLVIIYWQNKKLNGYAIEIKKNESIIRQIFKFVTSVLQIINIHSNSFTVYATNEEYQRRLFMQFIEATTHSHLFKFNENKTDILLNN